MTEHSPEAIEAYPDIPGNGPSRRTTLDRTAFDRGRASKHLTDRETIAAAIGNTISPVVGRIRLDDLEGIEYDTETFRTGVLKAADAILSSPSLSLVATDREVFRVIEGVVVGRFKVTALGLSDEVTDALFASNTIKPSSESDARAIEAAVEDESVSNRYGDRERLLARAARIRSGKADQ